MMVDKNPNGNDNPAPSLTIRVVEQDGNTFEIECFIDKIQLLAITELEMDNRDLIVTGLHIAGPGQGAVSPRLLRHAARELGRQWGADRVIIEGGIRTTGANPGHKPRTVTIRVEQ